MANKKVNQGDERLENVDNALSKTELWIEKHRILIYCIIGAIVVIAGVIWGLKALNERRNDTASNEIFVAQKDFEKGSYETALNGDDNHLGFVQINDSYGRTKTGKLAACYAGVCSMKLGKYQEAIKYFEKFNGDDEIVAPLSLGAIGDCYMELGDMKNAISYYEKAAEESKNEFSSPRFYIRAAEAYEITGDYNSALKCYKQIKEDFPTYQNMEEVNKSIALMEQKLKH